MRDQTSFCARVGCDRRRRRRPCSFSGQILSERRQRQAHRRQPRGMPPAQQPQGAGPAAVDRRSGRAGAGAERRPAGRSHRPAGAGLRRSRSPGAAGRRRSSRTSRPAARPTRRPTSSAAPPALTNENLTSQAGVQQALPWGGGSYTAFWNSGRVTTNNIFSSFNPQLNSTARLQLHAAAAAQLQDRRDPAAGAGQHARTARSRTCSCSSRSRSTTRNVKNAYWDLVYAINNLAVQQQSLQLAQQSFRDNRARVEIGTMAPLDIVQAEAEVAQREEAVILAEAAIRARRKTRCARSSPIRPISRSSGTCGSSRPTSRDFQPVPVDVDAAVRNALANRTDLVSVAQADRGQRHLHPLFPQPVAARRQRAGQLQRRSGSPARSSTADARASIRPMLGRNAARLLRRARRRVRARTSRPGRCSCR